jgi:hypothetical protein
VPLFAIGDPRFLIAHPRRTIAGSRLVGGEALFVFGQLRDAPDARGLDACRRLQSAFGFQTRPLALSRAIAAHGRQLASEPAALKARAPQTLDDIRTSSSWSRTIAPA